MKVRTEGDTLSMRHGILKERETHGKAHKRQPLGKENETPQEDNMRHAGDGRYSKKMFAVVSKKEKKRPKKQKA